MAASSSSLSSQHKTNSSLVEALAGLTAGSASTLTLHPLDLIKTRMQVHQSSASSTPPTTAAILRHVLASPRPIASLYRGLAPNLIGNASGWASFFFFKSQTESLLRKTHAVPGSHLAPPEYFVASGLAGVATTLLTNPVWVLKTRLLATDRASAGAYPGFATGMVRLWNEEGVRGLYRGLGASLLGVSHGAVQFAVYEPTKRFYLSQRARATPRKDGVPPGQRLDNQATLAMSTLAKLVAGATTYPYQVVRSRMQNYEAEKRHGRGVWAVVRGVWVEEGVRGFYRGVSVGMVRVLPATWVTFLVYENMRYYLANSTEV